RRRNRESALPQKRDQHRYAPTIWSVSIGAKFGGQKTFFHARLLPEPEGDQQGTEQSRDRPDRDAGRQHGCNKPGIDRVANETVWTGIDDPVAFFACDRVRPEPSEVDSRPPGEQGARQGQPRKKVGWAVAEIPQRFLSEYLSGPGRKQNGARQDRNPVRARVPGPDVFFGSSGKKRGDNPADKPGDPDQRQQLRGPCRGPSTPCEGQDRVRGLRHGSIIFPIAFNWQTSPQGPTI